MSTLAQLEVRVSARLVDASNVTFALATVDEAIRTALADYSTAIPFTNQTFLTLAAVGREISLSTLTGLINVQDVWWPYDNTQEVWPPNMVAGFRIIWDNGAPTLFLSTLTANQPQIGDKVRVWYSKPHTINGLDGAGVTTVFPMHESAIVTGAAAYAVASEMRHQIGSIHVDPQQVLNLKNWQAEWMLEFRVWLDAIRAAAPSSGPVFAQGWGIDKWDSNRNPRAGQYPTW